MDIDREATAYHEAGHAVADAVAELRFRYVTLRPRNGDAGHVMQADCGLPDRGQWLDVAAGSCAGIIAEDLYLSDHAWMAELRPRDELRRILTLDAGGHDLRYVRDVAGYAWVRHQHEPGWSATPIEPEHSIADLATAAWQRAVQLVLRHADAVAELARMLLGSRRAITWRQVREIVADHEPHPDLPEDQLQAEGLWHPWFLDHSRLQWTPRAAERRALAAVAS